MSGFSDEDWLTTPSHSPRSYTIRRGAISHETFRAASILGKALPVIRRRPQWRLDLATLSPSNSPSIPLQTRGADYHEKLHAARTSQSASRHTPKTPPRHPQNPSQEGFQLRSVLGSILEGFAVPFQRIFLAFSGLILKPEKSINASVQAFS